jgi:hypothetical protein
VGIVASIIAGPDTIPEAKDDQSVGNSDELSTTPAGLILLVSLTGLAICFVWIWLNGRAWR